MRERALRIIVYFHFSVRRAYVCHKLCTLYQLIYIILQAIKISLQVDAKAFLYITHDMAL